MSVLSVVDAKLLISNSPVPSERYSDAYIQRKIDAAEQKIARIVGPLIPTPVTVSGVNQGKGLSLPIGPYVGPISAVSRGGVALTSWATATVDTAGILQGLPVGAYELTYVAGWPAGGLPADIYTAIEEQFLHLWSFRRGNTRTPDAERGAAHAVPFRVSELIEPYRWDVWP